MTLIEPLQSKEVLLRRSIILACCLTAPMIQSEGSLQRGLEPDELDLGYQLLPETGELTLSEPP